MDSTHSHLEAEVSSTSADSTADRSKMLMNSSLVHYLTLDECCLYSRIETDTKTKKTVAACLKRVCQMYSDALSVVGSCFIHSSQSGKRLLIR